MITTKISLVGKPEVGKTSIKKVVFEGADPNEIMLSLIEPTISLTFSTHKIMASNIVVLETPGQSLSVLLKDEERQIKSFDNANVIIYIFDYPSWIELSEDIIEDVRKIYKINKTREINAKLILFLHKIDLIETKDIDFKLDKIKKKVNKLLNLPEELSIYFTSLHPNLIYTIYNALASTLIQVITQHINILELTKQKLKVSEEKYRNAYNRTNLYKDIFTHDINNILQNILSSVELIEIFSYKPKKKQEFEEVTNLIIQQIVSGENLVKNVQNLSQIEDNKEVITSIEAVNILKQACEALKRSLQNKTINIEINSLQNEYYVRANELLRNLFEKILFNAVNHNQNPTIEILTKITKENKNGINFIKFQFLDNGIGIHDSMKDKIFSREFKEEEAPSGIGLGLLLVKRLVERYEGQIKVEDKIKGDHTQGSNFIILIPEVFDIH